MSRLGRWIDFEKDYKTLYPWFMETIWCVWGGGRLGEGGDWEIGGGEEWLKECSAICDECYY